MPFLHAFCPFYHRYWGYYSHPPRPAKTRRKRIELAPNPVISKVALHRVPTTAKTSQRGEKINPCTHLDFRHSGLHFQLARRHTPGRKWERYKDIYLAVIYLSETNWTRDWNSSWPWFLGFFPWGICPRQLLCLPSLFLKRRHPPFLPSPSIFLGQ